MNAGIDGKVCVETVRRTIADIMRENTKCLLECEDLVKRIAFSLTGGVNTDCDCLNRNAGYMREEVENQASTLQKIVETLNYILRILEG